jgi:CRISPR-associated protein Cmr2
MTHLALVLSPITDTITKARKTRELWAASFIFSRTMYHLLSTASFGTVIAPAFSAQKAHSYGAGIYHDRCLMKLNGPELPDVEAWLTAAFKLLADELDTDAALLRQLIKAEVVVADWGGDPPGNLIHELNRLLDNLELRADYQPIEPEQTLVKLLDKKIQKLYGVGYESGKESIFIPMAGAQPARLPSVPEIALRELTQHPEETVKTAYKTFVEQPFSDQIEILKGLGGRAKDLKKKLKALKERGDVDLSLLEDTQLANELFFQHLKKEVGKEIKFRHKYLAVVLLDGDGLGTTISDLKKNNRTFEDFSKKLMAYSDEAVQKVVEYGGTPIYAGGDDLLFLAPVAMRYNAGPKDVLSLCAELDALFRDQMKDETLSLSGGVFVGFYKFPLGEAVAEAKSLEKKAKSFKVYDKADDKRPGQEWKPSHTKQAITFAVRKHSGQTFGSTLWLGSQSFPELASILNFDEDLEAAFLTSAMRRLQSMPSLLAEVARSGDPQRLKAFKKHQFGKGGRHEGDYLNKVLAYATAVFASYGDRETDEQLTERIFAALRFHQFLIQADHD